MNAREINIKFWEGFLKYLESNNLDLNIKSTSTINSYLTYSVKEDFNSKIVNRGSIMISVNKGYIRVGLMIKKSEPGSNEFIKKIDDIISYSNYDNSKVDNSDGPNCKTPTYYIEKDCDFSKEDFNNAYLWMSNIIIKLKEKLSSVNK